MSLTRRNSGITALKRRGATNASKSARRHTVATVVQDFDKALLMRFCFFPMSRRSCGSYLGDAKFLWRMLVRLRCAKQAC